MHIMKEPTIIYYDGLFYESKYCFPYGLPVYYGTRMNGDNKDVEILVWSNNPDNCVIDYSSKAVSVDHIRIHIAHAIHTTPNLCDNMTLMDIYQTVRAGHHTQGIQSMIDANLTDLLMADAVESVIKDHIKFIENYARDTI